jgi:hypothetical protein
MKNIIEELSNTITEYKAKLGKINNGLWDYQSTPNKWTRKEILGHLIDSAANNHQRFVRAQIEEDLQFTYDQNSWVKLQNYKSENAKTLIELWYYYNLHLINVINNIAEDKFKRKIDIKKEEPVTLEWVISDYLRHLKHHLNQIVLK